MKKYFTIMLSFASFGAFAQIQQNINKTNLTVSLPINQLDSIRFDTITNQMVVVTNSGNQTHGLADIFNVTFGNASNLTPCGGGVTSISDIDGNVYPVVQIGTQCWTAENLKTSKFADGSLIPNVTNNAAWSQLITPAWCNLDNNVTNDITYGKLYNWFTVADPRNVCPTDWHVPTDTEWTVLTDFLGGASIAGGKMKSTTGWNSPNFGATNQSGFSGLPGGNRSYFDGAFSVVSSSYGQWWSASESTLPLIWYRGLNYNNGSADRYNTSKPSGFSVRCIKD